VQWNIVGWSKPAIETAVATLQSVKPAPPATMADPPVPTAAESDGAKHIRISSGVSTGLLIKKVTPVYPPEALHGRVQGSVVLRAAINKTGDIADLEVVSGPIELVVSAVNAVRKWKYRPYLFKGEPVEVDTQIVVNYALNWK
jgi:protein TonB